MKLNHDLSRPVTTWLTLSDSKHNNNNWGDLMFSLSYLPTAERLTVVVVKARRLHLTPPSTNDGKNSDENIENVFVKVGARTFHIFYNYATKFVLIRSKIFRYIY